MPHLMSWDKGESLGAESTGQERPCTLTGLEDKGKEQV